MPERGSRPTSSPRASSSSGGRQSTSPSYLSPRSADVILSEVRPTRIKSEALRSVNVFLDELLWLILGYARSFDTERLRMGLLKILPTGLGKDALLEAEVELRAYIERNPPVTPLSTDEHTIQKFPLQQAFELLRIKCEAYSSLGDQTENAEVESALHSRMVQVAGDSAPNFSSVAPAALYLTAVLEHICEHVLANVGQVVARDSSRTTAHAQDLYVALCEDESIYSLFKTMKVQDQIEQQAKTPPQRRSKSISRNDIVMETPPPEPASDAPSVPKPRHSLDSAASNGSNNNNLPNRTSMDKARSKILFKNPSSRSLVTDNTNVNSIDALNRHRRSNSLLGGDKKQSTVSADETAKAEPSTDQFLVDDDSMEFDDLMRSGTTMKVSLTPDRLKTFEVFAKEKNLRANRGTIPPSPSTRDVNPPSSFTNGSPAAQKAKQQLATGRNRVESIAETPEEQVRSRSSSTTNPVAPKDLPSNSRARSFTDSRTKRPVDASEAIPPVKRNMPVAVIDPTTGMPKRTQRGGVRHRESLDLDDIMDGSDDDLPVTKKSPLTPKSAQASTSGARELMDFLSEGPPEPPTDLSLGPSAYDPQKSNKGRFRTIVSRLTGGASNERLRAGEEGADIRRSSTMVVNGGLSPRPPPLHSKRSVPNVSVAARTLPQSASAPTFPPQAHEVHSSPSVPRTRQASLTRKAVPAWESRGQHKEKDEPSLPVSAYPRPPDPQKPLPDPAAPSAVQSLHSESNGGVSPSRRRVPREPEPSKETSNQSVALKVQITPSPFETSSTNGHAKPEQEALKPAAPAMPSNSDFRPPAEPERTPSPSAPSRSERRIPGLTLSIPPDELIGDMRRLMARATTADECRVLMEMFFAKCGASGDKKEVIKEVAGPITPPVSPIRSDVESRHESNLIEVLLGDGLTSPMSVLATVTPPPSEATPPTEDAQAPPIEPSEKRISQSSPTVTLAPSPVAAMA